MLLKSFLFVCFGGLVQVSFPFIVLHGGDDKVTDKAVSELLYDVASSTDKTFKLYPDMWHGLLYGETPKNSDIVFSDIISWLEERSAIGNSRLEREQKLENDDFDLSKTKKMPENC
jgi:caffeoylshikimate esterase